MFLPTRSEDRGPRLWGSWGALVAAAGPHPRAGCKGRASASFPPPPPSPPPPPPPPPPHLPPRGEGSLKRS
eukprot:7572464-Pyramimonas_sp.AAC.1